MQLPKHSKLQGWVSDGHYDNDFCNSGAIVSFTNDVRATDTSQRTVTVPAWLRCEYVFCGGIRLELDN